MADKKATGCVAGESNPRALLTAKQVGTMRLARQSPNPPTLRDLASTYGVDFTTVDKAIHGNTWTSGVGVPPCKRKLRRITREERGEMYGAWKNGETALSISKRYGVSDTTVGIHLKWMENVVEGRFGEDMPVHAPRAGLVELGPFPSQDQSGDSIR